MHTHTVNYTAVLGHALLSFAISCHANFHLLSVVYTVYRFIFGDLHGQLGEYRNCN